MILAVLTETSQTWITVNHIASAIGALSGSAAAGWAYRAAKRSKTAMHNSEEIKVKVNGQFSRTVAELKTVTEQLRIVTEERDTARANQPEKGG